MAQWSTRTARVRRSPVGFIRPCQPSLANRVPTGPEWIHELKYDGYRVVARRDGDIVRLWSRAGLNWAYDFPRIVEALRRLPIERIFLDGEAVCLRDDGTPDFRTLRSRRGCRDARLMAFDLLGLEGTSIMPLPLEERRRQLARLLEEADDGLLFSGHVENHQGEALLRHACEANLEGIVSKLRDRPYRSGPTKDWLKIRCSNYRR